MRTNAIRWRVLLTLAVVVVSAWAMYPPSRTITLGLDLKGGVHFVLRVKTEDVLRRQTEAAAEQVQQALRERGFPAATAAATSATEFVVTAADRPAAAAAVPEIFAPVATGPAVAFRMRPEAAGRIREETVTQALATVERRVNALGVSEPVVARYSREDQLLVQLPGATDVAHAKRIISSTAQLRLTLVEGGPFDSREAALRAHGPAPPSHLEVLPERTPRDAAPAFYVVRRVPAVAGDGLRDAQASRDEFNRPAVAFTLRPDAARRFGAFTQEHTGRLLATVLDGQVTSVATILGRIDDRGQIVGFSYDEMLEQVVTLRSGALPADMEYEEQLTVSASLGEASVRAGLLACAAGLLLVVLFMLTYYRRTGLNALVSILLNLLIQLAFVAWLGVVMTLPGIAGLVLTIGMGVDSNVLIFERIKEELAAAATPRAAVKAGFARVWITIVDTHVASLVAAAVLYQFGTGPIRSFATTLTLGLLANVFTAVFVSRLLFDLVLARRERSPRALSI